MLAASASAQENPPSDAQIPSEPAQGSQTDESTPAPQAAVPDAPPVPIIQQVALRLETRLNDSQLSPPQRTAAAAGLLRLDTQIAKRAILQAIQSSDAAVHRAVLGAIIEHPSPPLEVVSPLRALAPRIDAALAKGDDSPFKGRPAKIKKTDVEKAVKETGSKAAAAKVLGISRDSVYRLLRKT